MESEQKSTISWFPTKKIFTNLLNSTSIKSPSSKSEITISISVTVSCLFGLVFVRVNLILTFPGVIFRAHFQDPPPHASVVHTCVVRRRFGLRLKDVERRNLSKCGSLTETRNSSFVWGKFAEKINDLDFFIIICTPPDATSGLKSKQMKFDSLWWSA